MTTKKWLNLIIDGNSTLGPYWPKIVSEYLEKIVRTFIDNSREEGANHHCEVGLVMYNDNSDLGSNVQYIHWTRDVDYFLGILSCLVFKGDSLNQNTMVEGLASALTLFPRPSNKMTAQEYYDGERHCILITARDPIPKRMLVSVPEIQGRFIGTKLHTLKADFYEVAKMFGSLAVSLSIISPIQHPIFGVIFNMGNNDSSLANTPISDCRNEQFIVLLSRNFREAHYALHEKRTMDPPTKESVESLKTTNDIILAIDFADDHEEDLFSIMMTGKQIIEADKDDRLDPISLLPLSVPNASTGEVGISTLPMVISTTPTFIVGEGSLKGVVGGNSGNCSTSTAIAVGMADPRDAPPAQNSMLPHSIGNTFDVQPYSSLSMLPYASSSSRSRPYLPFQVIGFGPLGRIAFGTSTGVPPAPITPQFNPYDFWPPPSSLTNFNDYLLEWEGSLAGKIVKKNRQLHLWVKVLRKATSPLTLTIEWPSRLEIALYLPQKAVNHTVKICRGPVDYVFLYLKQFDNLDLHDHLNNKNLSAKIHLPSQILMLTPTKSKHHFIGIVFPGDTIFIELL
ncbi:hypothetical protein AAZX31_20G029200 [Glycine max]|nr:hypothetical protein GLYMA_20G031800v4 [Glycine max]KAH1034320.1 hypothetical protein GYH30_054641 [Glycine max]